MIQLHLFSSPGIQNGEFILAACRLLLEGQAQPLVAYLPAASLQPRRWLRLTKTRFRGLAQVSMIDPEMHSLERICKILDRAQVLFIPGGNTYLLSQRLHLPLSRSSKRTREEQIEPGAGETLFSLLHTRITAGLPVVAFSAGSVLCGLDILTTNDINCCGFDHFEGLGLLPYNLNVHYPQAPGDQRESCDDRLQEYLAFHDQIILALEDDAYLRVMGDEINLVRGAAWKMEAGKTGTKLETGKI